MAIAVVHVLLLSAAAVAIIRYQQFWAIAAVLWLPLMSLALRWTTGFLKMIFESRKTDVLAVNGVTVTRHEDGATRERLANVAEEIAVATGERQPEAAICQSPGINAFIAYLKKEADRKQIAVTYTSAMVSLFSRHELQAVAAHLYAHRLNFERMFVMMIGAMYLAVFLAGDLFLILTVLNWNWGGSGSFSTGPLVVILVMGMLYGPILAASLACLQVMRRNRYIDDLRSLELTNDPQSLISALEKLSGSDSRLEAHYTLSNVHFYFDSVRDPSRRFPWQRLATHPRPEARIKALRYVTGLQEPSI